MIRELDSRFLNQRITNIIQFLRDNQGSNGEFRTLRSFHGAAGTYVKPTEYSGWYYFGKCPFSTANIVIHLRGIDLPHVQEIINRACEFLAKGSERGVWRYVPSYSTAVHFPADVDDTALSLFALKQNGYKTRDVQMMISRNISSHGMFYTWLIPRWRQLANIADFLWLTKDFLRSYRQAIRYGHNIPELFREHKWSAESAITANVILYLGENSKTSKSIDLLIKQINSQELVLQYYYGVPYTYFHVARLYHAGIKRAGLIRDKILSDLADRQQQNGQIENGLITALAALTFIYFGCWQSEVLQKAIYYLAGDAMHEKGWKPMTCWTDLEGKIFRDGSAELTATWYLEAIYRYSQHASIDG